MAMEIKEYDGFFKIPGTTEVPNAKKQATTGGAKTKTSTTKATYSGKKK